jgi:hypothetical protein
MTLAIIGLLTWLTTVTILAWRSLLLTRVRWRLYALRDRLRWAAIQDRTRLDSEVFWALDESLSAHCANLGEVSLWVVLPFLLFSPQARRETRELRDERVKALSRAENGELAAVYRDSCEAFVQALLVRHCVLFALLLPTVVGALALWRFVGSISQWIASGAVPLSAGRRWDRTAAGGPLAGAGPA